MILVKTASMRAFHGLGFHNIDLKNNESHPTWLDLGHAWRISEISPSLI